MTLRVVFAGTPAFALPPLRALLEAHDVVGLMTQPDRPAGRGRATTASPVKQLALEHQLPLLQPEKLRGDDSALDAVLAALREWRAEVMVVVAYGLMLPPSLLQLPRLGCLNIHASILPRWRGAAPIQRAILAGDASSGVSIMRMDEGLDTGDVLLRAQVPIGATDTAADLHDALAQLGAQQILLALEGWSGGTLKAARQPEAGVTYAAKLSRGESAITWIHEAVQIDRQIRAFNPWPVAETRWQGEPLKLLRSRVSSAEGHSAAAPGTVLGLRDDALEVACGQGVLQVLELQRAGRRAVTARDFLNAGQANARNAMVFG